MTGRRGTLASLVAAACLLASACSSSGTTPAPSATPATSDIAQAADWKPTSGQPLVEPEVISSEDGVLRTTLRAHEQVVVASGAPLKVMTFGDAFLSPTLQVEPGDVMEITLINDLDQMTNIHFHGFHVSPSGDSDNVFRMIGPGETAQVRVEIPDDHDTGMFWYHAHMHGVVEPQVFGGLAGVIRVGDITEHLPADFADITEQDFLLRDIQQKDDAIAFADADPFKPTQRVVNGEVMPTFSIAPGETQLWRFANVGADIFYDLEVPGMQFFVLAEDGNPVWEVWNTDHLVLPPGKRFEVLVTGPEAGTYELRTRKYDQGAQLLPTTPLATLTSEGSSQTPLEMPAAVELTEGDQNEPQDDATIAAERTFNFSFGTGKKFTALINGKVFDPNRVDVSPVLGTTEEWKLTNSTTEEHPFHVHVNDFQIMSVNGKPYDAHGLQDVAIIPAGGQIVIRMPFLDYTGKYVFHCHILGHEDAGMMAVVDVQDPG